MRKRSGSGIMLATGTKTLSTRYVKKLGIPALAFLLTLLIVNLFFLGVLAQNDVEIGLGGPYVDEIFWQIYSTNEAEMTALLAGVVDVMGWSDFSDIEAQILAEDPDIEVVTAPSALTFVFLVINVRDSAGTYSSPGAAEALNDVRFRKALAHMIDRQFLKDEVWGDILGIYDSVVPKAYEDWVSPNVVHYEHNFSKANQILDEAGYIDIGGDGYRETPTGQALSLKLVVSSTQGDVVHAAAYIEVWARYEAGININVEIKEPRALLEDVRAGRFDMWLVPQATISTHTGPDTILITSFYSRTESTNFAGFENTTYQGYVDAMATTLNETEAKENCWKAQELISDFLPVINIGEYLTRNAYRTDKFTGWVNEPGKAVTVSYWNWLNVRSKTSMGGTVRMSWFGEPLKSTFAHWRTAGGPWPYLTHDPLFMPSGPLEYEPTSRLATSWSYENATVGGVPGMIITFNLVRNATWHDGQPFTSADVKYTFDYLNEKKPVELMGFYATRGWIEHIETSDAYTVEVYVNRTSLFMVPGLGFVPIMPKHIWEGTDWQAIYDPFNATMNVGTGPWKFKDRVGGEYIKYEGNLDYYYPPSRPVAAGGIKLSPPSTSYMTDEYWHFNNTKFNVSVIVTNITGCVGHQFWVNYNSSVLKLDSWTFDTDPANSRSPTQMAPPPDDRIDVDLSVPGVVRLATAWKASSYSYAGDSVAAILTFQIICTPPPPLTGENNTVSTTLEFDSTYTRALNDFGDDILYGNFGDGYYEYTTRERLVGDVDGDRDVDLEDQHQVQLAMFTVPGDPNWNPNMDIDGDLDVDVGDQRKQQLHMFESW